METRISLIIPVYNTEKWLRECLDSVVNQIIPFDEVILVNDGSTDGSYDICRFYKAKYDYIKLISQENKGLSAVRNTGIRNISGDYIMFLDSDDYLRNDTAKIIKECLKREQYDAIYFDAEIHCVDRKYQVGGNNYDRCNSVLDGKIWSGWDFFFKCYPRDYVVSSCMAVFKKRVIDIEKLTFPEKIYYEDNYFSYRFMTCARKVIHISEKLYQRRYREDSIMTSLYSERKFADFIKVCRLIWEDIDRNNYKNIINKGALLYPFISDNYIKILNNYRTCLAQNIVLSNQSTELLCRVSEEYLNIIDKMDLEIAAMSLSDLDRMAYIFYYMKYWKISNEIEIDSHMKQISRLQREKYIELLKRCLFDRKYSKIGIYGTGKHTEGMFAIYERLIGEIKSDLIFIDTRKDNEVYKDRSVINYKKIKDQDFDLIVISSFIYEREMIQHVREISLDIPIYTFYDVLNGDVFTDYKIFLEYLC